MTNLDIESQQQRGEIDIISKADRYALLKMLDEKPRAIIGAALRDAARRGIFVDPMLDVAPPRSTSLARRAFKSTVLTGSLLALVWLGYVGSREYLTVPQKTQSVMGIKPDDVAKAVSKEEEDKNDIAYARLSEPARNAFKNYVPDTISNTKSEINCASNTKQTAANDIAGKAVLTKNPQRPAEPANKWIDRMIALKNAGKTNELLNEFRKFRQTYPDAALPTALQALTC
jgi:hypothetical protein